MTADFWLKLWFSVLLLWYGCTQSVGNNVNETMQLFTLHILYMLSWSKSYAIKISNSSQNPNTDSMQDKIYDHIQTMRCVIHCTPVFLHLYSIPPGFYVSGQIYQFPSWWFTMVYGLVRPLTYQKLGHLLLRVHKIKHFWQMVSQKGLKSHL